MRERRESHIEVLLPAFVLGCVMRRPIQAVAVIRDDAFPPAAARILVIRLAFGLAMFRESQ